MPARFLATIRPMYSPPTITALDNFLSVIKLRMARVSSTVRMVIILGSSVPDMSGTRAWYPRTG